jgi:hypothetical protein
MEKIKLYIDYLKKIKELNDEKRKIMSSLNSLKPDVLYHLKQMGGVEIKCGDCRIKLCHKKIYEKIKIKDKLLENFDHKNVEQIMNIINDKKFDEQEDLKISIK